MPELPEVETIRKQLSDYLPFSIQEEWRSPFLSSILHTPNEKLQGDCITQLQRHGKILIFQLQSGRLLVGQLGMSGSWRISPRPLREKHLHLQLQKKGYYLSYVDPRRFGHLYIWGQREWVAYRERQGVDPSTPQFTIGHFSWAIKKFPQRMVKITLLDQSLFSGVGNYMANEICALAKVRPTRRCHRITNQETQALFTSTTQVVCGALASGGTTFQGGYRDIYGSEGEGVKYLQVFYQTTCGMCQKTPVKKIFLQKRGTYYCPLCQK